MNPSVRTVVTSLAAGLLTCACSSAPSMAPPARPATSAAVPVETAAGDRMAAADERFHAALKLMKDGDPQQAEDAFNALVKDFPEYSGPMTDLGILYAQGRKRDQALASLNSAVGANPDNALAYNWLGVLYRESGDFPRAEQCYRKALGLRGDYAAAHLNLAILYDVSLHQPTEALAQYRDYRKSAAKANPMVDVWIKELETSSPTAAAVAVGGTP